MLKYLDLLYRFIKNFLNSGTQQDLYLSRRNTLLVKPCLLAAILMTFSEIQTPQREGTDREAQLACSLETNQLRHHQCGPDTEPDQNQCRFNVAPPRGYSGLNNNTVSAAT